MPARCHVGQFLRGSERLSAMLKNDSPRNIRRGCREVGQSGALPPLGLQSGWLQIREEVAPAERRGETLSTDLLVPVELVKRVFQLVDCAFEVGVAVRLDAFADCLETAVVELSSVSLSSLNRYRPISIAMKLEA